MPCRDAAMLTQESEFSNHAEPRYAESCLQLSMAPDTVHRGGLEEIADKYDAFLLDQFGVLHDGVHALPDAVRAVAQLTGMAKKMVILSNSSKRGDATLKRITELGFPEGSFSGAVTSGEMAWQTLHRDYRGKKALVFSWADTCAIKEFLADLDITPVGIDLDSADFIIAQGVEAIIDADYNVVHTLPATVDDETSMDLLKRAAVAGKSLVCCNADVFCITGGIKKLCPGHIAASFREFGGSPSMFGKPYGVTYDEAMRLLKMTADSDRSKALVVGDSLHHDIKGGNDASIDSLFIAGGIHATELGMSLAPLPHEDYDRANCTSICSQAEVTPTHALPFFRWTAPDAK